MLFSCISCAVEGVLDTAMDYLQALEFLDSLASEAKPTRKSMKLGRIRLLLQLMGQPQGAYRSIHVVGTAGKGSVATMAAAILQEHGYRSGLHVSPHLQVINERMQVDGRMASGNEFALLAQTVAALCPKVESQLGLGEPTYYEATLAMALEHFRRKKVDYAVVEAGLGGRFDGTNVLEPVSLIFTNAFLDHQRILGRTISRIAQDKAGAVKVGVPVATGASGMALAVLQKACKGKHAPLLIMGRDFGVVEPAKCTFEGNRFDLRVKNTVFRDMRENLVGAHQAGNFALAAAAVAAAGVRLEGNALHKAACNLFVPCRFEVVQQNPLVVLDGAHNPAKVRALAASMDLFPQGKVGVLAIARDKDARQMLKTLLPRLQQVTFTKVPSEREFWEPKALRRIAGMGMVEPDPQKAVGTAIKSAGGRLVLVTGSFFLAGLARKRWVSDKRALERRTLAIRSGQTPARL